MPYDDIRFSGWDDPDDGEFGDDDFEGFMWWIDMAEFDPPEGQECVMCGKERTLNPEGYCSTCWTIWNS